MATRHHPIRRRIAIVTTWSLLLSPGGGVVRVFEPLDVSAAAIQGTTPAKPPTAAPRLADGGWPRSYTTSSGAALIVYQPQVASWEDQKRLTLYSAVSYSPKGTGKPVLGTVKADADTRVSVAERLVDFSAFKITESNFPTLRKEQTQEIVAEIAKGIPQEERVIALDRVLASIDKSQILPKNIEGVKADPPDVFFSKSPAVVVNIDGDPIWSPIAGNDLKYAINTNWDLFEHGPTKTYYLRDDAFWLKASSLSEGAWTAAGKLPDSFAKLPADENWKDVRAALPGKTPPAKALPRVFVSTKPAELIMLTGEPSYLLVPGTALLWVFNTESDVFRLGRSGPVYYLVAGRWFSAPDFSGPWTFATPHLPADFQKIPLEHERSRVLAAVPGTPEAAEAVLLASVPQTARVDKKTLKAPEVKYQGDPEFVPIEKTTVQRAVNTDKDIIKVGDLYYMCFQGVWFMAKGPTGPWEVTGSVPKQIYEIPVSSPSHSVTYVTVQESHDDSVVFVAAAAYSGVMIAWGCAVWGSGYYYPPYVHYGPYPIYYPHYPTYGYSAWYNPWTGTYGRGAAVYGPYGGAGVGARYNPYTGAYARGAAAWGPYGGAAVGQAYNPRTGTYARGGVAVGPYGARGAAEAYNPRTGAYGATRQGSGVYGSWGTTGVQRGDQWATTSRVTSNVTGATSRVTQTSQGAAVSRRGPQGSGFVGANESGDMYAGHDGNVYRKQGDSWQKYDSGGWNSVQQPTPQQRQQAQARATAAGVDSSTVGQLNRDSSARSEGAQRTRDAGSVRSGASSQAGSYRPSGGARGGRRR
jgi:hypothetical protein